MLGLNIVFYVCFEVDFVEFGFMCCCFLMGVVVVVVVVGIVVMVSYLV